MGQAPAESVASSWTVDHPSVKAPSSRELCLLHTSKGRAEVCAAELETGCTSPWPLPYPQWMLRSPWAPRPFLHLALPAPPSPMPQVAPSSFVLVALPAPLSANGNWAMCPCLCSWLHMVCVPLIPRLPSRHRASASAPSQGPWSNIPMRLTEYLTSGSQHRGCQNGRQERQLQLGGPYT